MILEKLDVPARFVVEPTKAFPKDGHLGTGLPYLIGASIAERCTRPVMLSTSDSAFLFQIAELETAARENFPLVCVIGLDHHLGLEVGVYKRTFQQLSPQLGVHRSKDVRFDKIGEGFGCHGESSRRRTRRRSTKNSGPGMQNAPSEARI